MNNPQRANLPDADALTDLQATLLLQAGRRSGNRHVARLVERLEQRDGEAWLRDALHVGPLRDACSLNDVLTGVDVEVIARIKDASKRMVERGDEQSSLAGAIGAAGYYLAIAAGVVQHGQKLSSGPARDLQDNLLEIAASAPEGVADLLAKAAARLEPSA